MSVQVSSEFPGSMVDAGAIAAGLATATFAKKSGDTLRTTQAMLADIATSNDRGLDRTGVVDARPGLQALIDEHAGETVRIKAGIYKIDNTDYAHCLHFLAANNNTKVECEPGVFFKLTTWMAGIVLYETVGIHWQGGDYVMTASYPYNGVEIASTLYRTPFETQFGPSFSGGDRNYLSMFCMYGAERCRFRDMRFYHQTPGAQNFMESCFIIAPHSDGSVCYGNTFDDMWMDDFVFGIVPWSQVHGHIRNVHNKYRYHQPNENWQANGHLVYVSSAGLCDHFDISGIHDDGVLQSAPGQYIATVTMNYRGLKNSDLSRVYSTRNAGFISVDTLTNCTMSRLVYTPAAYTVGGTVVLEVPDTGGVNIAGLTIDGLKMTGDFGNKPPINIVPAAAANVSDIKAKNVDLTITVTNITTSSILTARCVDSKFRMDLRLVGTYTIERALAQFLDGSLRSVVYIDPAPNAIYSRVAPTSANNVDCFIYYEGVKPMPYGTLQTVADAAGLGGITYSRMPSVLAARKGQGATTSLSAALAGVLPKGRWLVCVGADNSAANNRATAWFLVDNAGVTPTATQIGSTTFVGSTITALGLSCSTGGVLTVTGTASVSITWFMTIGFIQMGDGV